jgi:hypothetical protein
MNNYSNINLGIIDFTNINKIIDIPITIYFMMTNLTYTLQKSIQYSMQEVKNYENLSFKLLSNLPD